MRQDDPDYQSQLHALTQLSKSFSTYYPSYRGYDGVIHHASTRSVGSRSYVDCLSQGIDPGADGRVVWRHRSTQVAAAKGYNALMALVVGGRNVYKNTGNIAACLDKVDALKPLDSFAVLAQLSPFCEMALQIAVCERQPCVARLLDSIERLPDSLVVELLEYEYKCPISLALGDRGLADEIRLNGRTIFQIAKDCGLSRTLQARMRKLLQNAKHQLWKESCRKFFVCGAKNVAEPAPPVIDDELRVGELLCNR